MNSIRIEAHHPTHEGSLVWWGDPLEAARRLQYLLTRTAERPEHRWPAEGWEMETWEVVCPKCGAANLGRKVYIRIDEYGKRYECSCCSSSWPIEHADTMAGYPGPPRGA